MSLLPRTAPVPLRADLTEGPAYLITPDDLVLAQSACPFCRRPRPILETRALPIELQGGARRRAPSFELLGDLRRFIRPEADNHGCSYCELLIAINRLLPPRDTIPAVESPADAAIRQMRAAAIPTPPDPSSPPVDGALFDAGKVYTTPGALTALLAAYRPELDRSIGGILEVARPFALEFLRRHATGDFGMIGTQSDADADKGRLLGPLASALDQNAAAIADGRGTVQSTYRIEQLDIREPSWGGPARTEKNGSVLLSIHTELAGSPTTLVALASETNQ